MTTLRVAYHEALENTESDLNILGALIVDSLHHAVKAVETSDAALSARIIAGADQTAYSGRRIESTCIELIWRQQPLADELRLVTTMYEISNDLQRIDYYVTDIAKHAVRLAEKPPNAPRETFRGIARLSEDNLKNAMRAFKERDLQLARDVTEHVEQYERQYTKGIRALQKAISADAEILPAATELLFICTSLQRINEHASNISWHTSEMLDPEAQA